MSKDALGDRIKSEYEYQETGRKFLKGLPVICRLDGRGFSKFTKNMQRPYDLRMIELMTATMKYVFEESNAIFGFTQSDEISLVYFDDQIKSDIFFNRKITKMTSILSAISSSFFAVNYPNYFGYDAKKHQYPHFDARVIQFPNKSEAANAILWRAQDGCKNSVSMLAQHHFSHRSLQGLSSAQMQEKLFQEKQINYNDENPRFKQGTFIRKVKKELPFDKVILSKIPENKRANLPETIVRSVTEQIDMPIFSKVINRIGVIFDAEDPKLLDN
jgi:tRNA(His) 5'-end guanylyltransferase